MRDIPLFTGESGEGSESFERGFAELVRAASRDVYRGWTIPAGDSDPGDVQDRAIEAQVVAAVVGRKPLYYEPWGAALSEEFRRSYRKIIPKDVVVAARNGMLFIYRPEVLRPLLDANPAIYRREGETELDSIARVSAEQMNGELLGYGAVHVGVRPAYEVRIFMKQNLLLYCFISAPDESAAALIANERTADFARAHGWKDLYFVMQYLE